MKIFVLIDENKLKTFQKFKQGLCSECSNLLERAVQVVVKDMKSIILRQPVQLIHQERHLTQLVVADVKAA